MQVGGGGGGAGGGGDAHVPSNFAPPVMEMTLIHLCGQNILSFSLKSGTLLDHLQTSNHFS